jgi:predicted small lipoprotein YifL
MVPGMQNRRPFFVLPLMGVLVALTLAGCGRKGDLDLPPGATVAPAPEAETRSVMSPIARPSKPQPRVTPKRSLPIDVLLD